VTHVARAIDRARKDVDAGNLWIARDRLTGYLAAHPTDQAALDLLGEVYFAMGDHPAAGRFWFLTDRDDEPARRSIEALRLRHRKSLWSLTETLPAYAPLEEWPPQARGRLRALQREAEGEGWTWTPAARRRTWDEAQSDEPGRWDTLLFLLFGGILFGPWLLGWAALVYAVLWLAGVV
jgi:hypothetical protein